MMLRRKIYEKHLKWKEEDAGTADNSENSYGYIYSGLAIVLLCAGWFLYDIFTVSKQIGTNRI